MAASKTNRTRKAPKRTRKVPKRPRKAARGPSRKQSASRKAPSEARANDVAVELPAPDDLERVCKGLAILDAMMSEDWESRYYSFDRAWSTKAKQRLASMRNGEGDEWFIAFSPSGVLFKAFWHEHRGEDASKIYSSLPSTLAPLLKEPAFSMDDVTFGGWHDGTSWTLRGNAEPLRDQLALLAGDADAYRSYASSYFEVELPEDAIASVLAGDKLDAKLVARLTTERTLADLKDDLATIIP